MTEVCRHNILGVMISAVDYQSAVTSIIAAARDQRPYAVSALAVHGVMTGVLDRVHRHRLNRLDMLTPDGQPVRWALNWLYRTGLKERVYGPNLMLEVCGRAAQEGLPIFLFGGTENMLDQLESRLISKFPALQIAGRQASRFRRLTEEEFEETARAIRDSGAAITFVGIGCPRQEVWAYEMRDRLSMPVLAVGAAFAFHAGQLSQAPAWLQSRGLEWLFRLLKEPRRLWKRYVLLNPTYLGLLTLQFTGLLKFSSDTDPAPNEIVRFG